MPDPTPSAPHSSRSTGLRGRFGALQKYAFGLRLTAALTVSMALLMGVTQVYFTQAVSQQLIDQGERFFAAEGLAVERAYNEGDTRVDRFDDAVGLVSNIASRPDIVSAAIFDADMRKVVVSDEPERVLRGERDPNPQFSTVLSGNQIFAGHEAEGEEGDSHFEYIVPLKLGGERFVLEVDQDATEFSAQVAAMRKNAVVLAAGTLLLSLILFYVTGGRALARRHGKAIKGATRDSLTELGNHSSFQEELARMIAFATRRREPFALALIDLDDFKFVNDRFGHRRGDEVLTEIARLLESGRAEDRAFRIGGDEFALLMPGSDSERASVAVQRLLARAKDDRDAMSFSAGIAVATPGVEVSAAALWEQADAALYEGKRTGGSRVVVFDEVAETLSVVTPDKVHALRSLLAEPRLQTAFQPIWKLEKNEVLGYEALARPWDGYGFEGPGEAFAVAEKIGRAQDLDAICRAAALERAKELPGDALLFLNLNPQSLTHDMVDGDRLARAVKAVGFDPKRVVLEITERSEARLDHVIADATRLRSLGFGLALDDVGAGNNGLEMLRDLPVDYVKIDNSVIIAAVDDPQAQAVLVAIIAYARRAGAFVIAEGIESEEILDFVENAHELDVMQEPVIDGGQGFLLGRPDPDLQKATPFHAPSSGRQRSRPVRAATQPAPADA